jgi:signal transduction histidine kinase
MQPPRPSPRDPGHASRWTAIFAPAMAVMNRLSYGRKFVLIGMLLAIPGAALLSLQLSSAEQAIDFGRRERSGVAYLEPLWSALYTLERHRILDAVQAPRAEREAARLAAHRAMEAMDEVDRRLGDALGTREAWGAIRRAWASESADAARLPARVVALMLPLVANTSNLILDPDLESYWLVEAYVGKLPQLAEAIALTGEADRAAGPDGAARPGDVQAAAQEARRLAAALVQVNMASAFGGAGGRVKDWTLRARLQPEVEATARAMDAFAPIAPPEGGAAARAAPVALAALDSVDALHRRLGPELDRLLESRIERHRRQRTLGLTAAAAAALVATYLFLAFYLSVRELFRTLAPSAPSAAHGAGADELGQIAVAYTREKGERSRLEEQLRQADRLATLGMLAAGAAHELNEPLGSILGFAQLCAKTPALPEPARRDLAKISKAALHAREIIKKLLLFARQTPPQLATIDLNAIVEEGIELLVPQCEKSAIQVERELPWDLPPVVADPGQVRQVVLNLVVNAVQASPRGGRIRVSTSSDESHVQLLVEDFGSGMSEAVVEQIFLPFYTTKEVGQGTGLGLSVVHGIVSAHGGTVEVDSAPGQGARFRVRLPRAPRSQGTREVAPDAAERRRG